MKIIIPAYIRMLQEVKSAGGSSKSPVMGLTEEDVQQCVEENLKSLTAAGSEGSDTSSSSHALTCAVAKEVMYRMKATLTALGKTALTCSCRGAERMIRRVTRRINTCLGSQTAQQTSASTPENRSVASDVDTTTGEVMSIVLRTMESQLDDREDQHAKEVLNTVAATVKMIEAQNQTQKGVRSRSRHSTQSIDKLSDTEFQEKARNAVSDVLMKRLQWGDLSGDEKGGTPSISMADSAASTLTDTFIEEMMCLVQSTESLPESFDGDDVDTQKKEVQSAAFGLFRKMSAKVTDIFNIPKPSTDQDLKTSEEDLESCTKNIVNEIVMVYKSVSENDDTKSFGGQSSRESLVKMTLVNSVFAQLKNLAHGSEDIQVGSNKELQLPLHHQKSGTSMKSSSLSPISSEVCLHTLSGKSFQTEAIQAVSGVLKKSVTTLTTLTEPENPSTATSQDSGAAACEIVESFVKDVSSFEQLIQGSESVEGSGGPSGTDNQKTSAALKLYQKVKVGVKKYFIANTFQNNTENPVEEGLENVEAVDSCTKNVIGEIIGVYKSKVSDDGTEQPIQDVGGIISELEGLAQSTNPPKSEDISHGSKNISTRSSASSIQLLAATLQKLSSEKVFNQAIQQVSEVLIKSVKSRTGSDSSVQQDGSVSFSEAEMTALDVTDTVVKGVESLLQIPSQGTSVSESLIFSDLTIRSTTRSIFQNLQGKVKDFFSKHHTSDDKMSQKDTKEAPSNMLVSTQDGQPCSNDSTTKEVQLLRDLAAAMLEGANIQPGECLLSSEPRSNPPSLSPSISKPSSSKTYDALPGSPQEENSQAFSKELSDRIKSLLLESNTSPQAITLIAGKSSSDSVLYMKENKGEEKKPQAALEMVYVFAEEAIRCLLQPYFHPSKPNTNKELPPRPVYSKIIDLFTRVMVCQVIDNVATAVEQEGDVHPDEVLKQNQPSQPTSKSSLGLISSYSTPDLSDDIIRDLECLEENTDTAPDSSLPLLDSDDYSCLVTMLILRLLAKIKDQQLISADLLEATRELIERVLLDFTDVSGIPKSSTHLKNAKAQRIYRIVYDYLTKELGTTAALKAVETQDLSFDQLLIMTLTKELLLTSDRQDPTTLDTPPRRRPPKLRINLKVKV